MQTQERLTSPSRAIGGCTVVLRFVDIPVYQRAGRNARKTQECGFMRLVRRASRHYACFNRINTRCYASPALFTSLVQFAAIIVNAYIRGIPLHNSVSFLRRYFLQFGIKNPSRGENVQANDVAILPSKVFYMPSRQYPYTFFFTLNYKKTDLIYSIYSSRISGWNLKKFIFQ